MEAARRAGLQGEKLGVDFSTIDPSKDAVVGQAITRVLGKLGVEKFAAESVMKLQSDFTN